MAHEIETAAADSLGGFFRFRRRAAHTAPVGSPCANCATPLMGPWCYACGQLGEDFHRSLKHLVIEACEGFVHFDGRLWRTVPDLLLHPARLTRAYLDGRRAPQVPPLRMLFVTLLILFLVGSATKLGGVTVVGGVNLDPHGVRLVEAPDPSVLTRLTPPSARPPAPPSPRAR
jgi:hypothetical protein